MQNIGVTDGTKIEAVFGIMLFYSKFSETSGCIIANKLFIILCVTFFH